MRSDKESKFNLIKKKDIRIIFYKSSGPGGQRKNKKETAVKVYHIPSGITVIATEQRSQVQNKELALSRLEKRLKLLNKKKKQRIPTKIPKHIKNEVLDEKSRHSRKKKTRARVDYVEE